MSPTWLFISSCTKLKILMKPSYRTSMINWNAFPKRGYLRKNMSWNLRLCSRRIRHRLRATLVKLRSVFVSSSISPKKDPVEYMPLGMPSSPP